MLKIDAHQHFWQYNPVRDSWINDEMSIIRKDFLPVDLEPLLREHEIDGCITVQSDQSEEENAFQLAHAEKYDFIKGVVGWVDLQAVNIEERLQYYSQFKKMKGFRHILQGEPQRDFMLRSQFMHGISHLKKYSFTYDILIFPDQLKYAYQLVKSFPEQPFVIDHIAKPNIKEKQIKVWKEDIGRIAECQNVFCKVSGMVTEADWRSWKKDDFTPYLDVITAAFGTSRLLFGSDWPVSLLAATYSATLQLTHDYFSPFTRDEQEGIFGKNAIKFYGLGNK